jgi:hypothetical protein
MPAERTTMRQVREVLRLFGQSRRIGATRPYALRNLMEKGSAATQPRKQIFPDIHCQDQRYRRDGNTPEEPAEAELVQTRDKAWPGGDADHGDEHIQADGIHEPHGGRIQPPPDQA